MYLCVPCSFEGSWDVKWNQEVTVMTDVYYLPALDMFILETLDDTCSMLWSNERLEQPALEHKRFATRYHLH